MSKAKFEYAKELIKEKRYSEARRVLREIDHPTAEKWLEELEKIAPSQNRSPIFYAVMFFSLVLTIVLIVFVVSLLNPQTDDTNSNVVVELPTSVVLPSALPSSTFTPTALPTLTQTATATLTLTVTLTPTNIPTSTITNTPRPTNTRIPTRTPFPTITPVPPQVQTIGPIADSLRDEIFSVEIALNWVQFSTGLGSEQAGRGKIYVLANVTVANLGPGSLRNLSRYNFQLKDSQGAVRDPTLIFFTECEFDTVDLTSGGRVSGCIAFEAPASGSLEIIYAPFQYEGLQPGRYLSFRVREI